MVRTPTLRPFEYTKYTPLMAIVNIFYVDFMAVHAMLLVEVIMPDKKTMTLNLTETEMNVLEELSAQKDLSKTAVIRQALRLYQMMEMRLARGEKLFFESNQTKEKAEL